ncbi:DUF4349 domain-containing protein [Amycolatopsis jiangsuensis]|uniref:DUF4349 domain-containing protein n=1 Tax=Amycolatopsis jiangsuensis TaxID=1181879 RepID=A0A840IXP4_9PSEU|nr:DUF4349 domain-containing protein [Amycolatopsis jiangsuensis]MBB4686630.1 hypothetical protein [Amycolatopsis jiangsuensis]
MRTRWRCLLAGCGLMVLLAGCSGTQPATSSAGAPADSGVAVKPEQRAAVQGAPEQSGPASEQSGKASGQLGRAPKQSGAEQSAPAPALPGTAPKQPAAGPITADRKLARSARLDVTTPKPGDVVSGARTIASAAGGYPGQETSSADSATLSLSVPAEKLDPVLDQLAALGKVTKRELSTRDVTGQVVDVDARLATQRTSVERVRALLAKAASVSEIASVESELTSREAELESLERQQAALAGTVAMATVTVSVTRSAVAQTSGESSGFLDDLADGWDGFLVFGGGLLQVLGALVPFAVVLGIPAGALGWWLRRRRRRSGPAGP